MYASIDDLDRQFDLVALFDVIEFIFFVDVNQHVAIHCLEKAGAIHFARLEDHVAIGQNHGRSPLFDVFDDIERIGEKPVGKRIVHQKT